MYGDASSVEVLFAAIEHNRTRYRLKIKPTNERIPESIRNFLRDCHHYLTDLRFV